MLGVSVSLLNAKFAINKAYRSGSQPMQCALQAPWAGIFDIPFLVCISVFLFLSYTNRIARLYAAHPDLTIHLWCVNWLTSRFGKDRPLRHIKDVVLAGPRRSKGATGAAYWSVDARRRYHVQILRLSASETRESISDWVRIVMFFEQELRRSFLGELLTLLFGVTYGTYSSSREQKRSLGPRNIT